MVNVYADVFDSMTELYKRFDLVPEVEAQERFIVEEMLELIAASVARRTYLEMGIDHVTEARNILEEAADLIYVIMGLVAAHGFTKEDFAAWGLYPIARKNDAKTPDTHVKVGRKLIKRELVDANNITARDTTGN